MLITRGLQSPAKWLIKPHSELDNLESIDIQSQHPAKSSWRNHHAISLITNDSINSFHTSPHDKLCDPFVESISVTSQSVACVQIIISAVRCAKWLLFGYIVWNVKPGTIMRLRFPHILLKIAQGGPISTIFQCFQHAKETLCTCWSHCGRFRYGVNKTLISFIRDKLFTADS